MQSPREYDISFLSWSAPGSEEALICLFSLVGIWPDGADGTDVNSVDRSHGKQLLATGDDFGNVNLYRYPCVSDKV